MAQGLLLGEYIAWHYSIGVAEFVRVWAGMHRFFYNYFSLPLLLRSLFAPFHRMQERRVRGFDPENLFEVFVVNSLMRIVGAVVRMVVIVIGIFAQGLVFVVGASLTVLFITAPVAIPASIVIGFVLLVS